MKKFKTFIGTSAVHHARTRVNTERKVDTDGEKGAPISFVGKKIVKK